MSQGSDTTNQSVNGKVYPSAEAALHDLRDGAVILVGGFAGSGVPETLLKAVLSIGIGNLTLICQGAAPTPSGSPDAVGVDRLIAAGLVRKLVAPLPFLPAEGLNGEATAAESSWKSAQLEIEVAPQGILAERLRAGGAGLGGVFLPSADGVAPKDGGETRTISGRTYAFHPPLKADFAMVKAAAADTVGNLIYRGSQRNWNPVMAMAGRVTVVEADQMLEIGGLDPEMVITPGIFVNRVVPSL